MVEDHQDSADATAKLLAAFGHQVSVAHSFAGAIETLRLGTGIDVLLTDIGLTDGSGWDLFHQAVSIKPDIQGIALSGYGTDEDLARSRSTGFGLK